MPKTAVVPWPCLSAKQASSTLGPVAVPRYPPRHASGITTSRWDVVVVTVDYESQRAVAMLRNNNFCLVDDEEGSRRQRESC